MKRAFDLFLICITSPIWGLILMSCCALCYVFQGRPIFFRQLRIGRNEVPFEIIKLRTMIPFHTKDHTEIHTQNHKKNHTLKDHTLKHHTSKDHTSEYESLHDELHDEEEKRVTRLGEFLRRSSLDELPEMWNVIKGDMSLVGPRPLLPEYLDLYTSTQKRRHEVLPGITGLAQIKGRNHLSWDEKFAYDIKYVERKSLLLDMKIMMITLWVGLRGRGVGAKKGTVGKRFEG